jgi:hypothetical protein
MAIANRQSGICEHLYNSPLGHTEPVRITDKNGDNIITRVPTGEALVRNLFGDSYWGMNRNHLI